jgi:ankyrin repeat protein
MLTPSDTNPALAAWKQRLENGDRERLFLDAVTNPDPGMAREIFQGLLLLATATEDRALAKMLEDQGIRTLDEREGHFGGILFDIMDEFGDAPEVVEWALNQGARIGARGINDWTPLHVASARGYLGVVRVLIAHGANINDETSIDDHWTPLMEATREGHKEIVEFLLANGADPTGALYMAKKFGPAEMVAVLERPTPKN